MTKMRKRLLYPVRVSQDELGRRIRKTSAFAPKGTDIPSHVSESLAKARKIWFAADKTNPRGQWVTEWRYSTVTDRELARIPLREQILAAKHHRHIIAQDSPFFIKRKSKHIQAIRQLLLTHGVRVEAPIEDLKDGSELFSRGKFKPLFRSVFHEGSLSLHYGYTPPTFIIEKIPLRQPGIVSGNIIQLVTRMHTLGITHGHLHVGNFALGPRNQIMLLDISRAKQYKRFPKNKTEFLKWYKKDIREMLETVDRVNPAPNTFQYLLDCYARVGMPTFNLTRRDLEL